MPMRVTTPNTFQDVFNHDRFLRVGDRIAAKGPNGVSLNGRVVCGWSRKLRSFTSQRGHVIADDEIIAVSLGPDERVRIHGKDWYTEFVDTALLGRPH